MTSQTLQSATALDAQDPLAAYRDRFELPDELIYLDGNSLGALVKGVAQTMQTAITEEWGKGLIRSWNDANWYPAPQRVGQTIARLIGAKASEVVVCDSTSINLYKVMVAAMRMRPDRKVIICEADNFPTDAYICASVAKQFDAQVIYCAQDDIARAIAQAGTELAVVQLTQVHYKTGKMVDMKTTTAQTHAQGALVVWDLAHSAGVLPLQLNDCDVDFAVGCGYKYLNGGPGAPAFVMVAEKHLAQVDQPLHGWHGHAAPYEFTLDYQAHAKIDRMLVGTAPQLSLIALEAALSAYDGVDMQLIRAKSQALTEFFIAAVDQELSAFDFGLATPRDATQRGSQVSLTHPQGYAIMQALIARGVIGDFRAPNILRFGFAPLYVRFADAWNAVQHLKEVMQTNEWNQPKFLEKKAVT